MNTPVILLFSKKWVPGLSAEDNIKVELTKAFTDSCQPPQFCHSAMLCQMITIPTPFPSPSHPLSLSLPFPPPPPLSLFVLTALSSLLWVCFFISLFGLFCSFAKQTRFINPNEQNEPNTFHKPKQSEQVGIDRYISITIVVHVYVTFKSLHVHVTYKAVTVTFT